MSTRVGPLVYSLTLCGPTTACGTTTPLTPGLRADLLAGALYVEVVTPSYFGGEIRGQIRPPVWSDLRGASTCHPSAPAGTGSFGARIGSDGSITYACMVVGIVGIPVALDIHANPGACLDGEVALPLEPLVGPAGGPFTTGIRSAGPDADPSLAGLYAGGFYCDLHTTAFPGGALRGEVRGGTLPMSQPGGCAGAGGLSPRLEWMGGPSRLTLPGLYTVLLSDALPGAPFLLLVGLTNSAPYPIDLQPSLGGSGACLLLNDSPLLIPGATAASGFCAGKGHHLFPTLSGASIGGTVYLQAVVMDPGGPLDMPLVLSNGLTVTIQT
ncbi:MAG: CHRD domain-containing protein [Planctomycetes bacterium]|nr:CHRD domain-containing protein [Planctomycetota bacterium]